MLLTDDSPDTWAWGLATRPVPSTDNDGGLNKRRNSKRNDRGHRGVVECGQRTKSTGVGDPVSVG